MSIAFFIRCFSNRCISSYFPSKVILGTLIGSMMFALIAMAKVFFTRLFSVDTVYANAFSGHIIVLGSISSDMKVNIWDTKTGAYDTAVRGLFSQMRLRLPYAAGNLLFKQDGSYSL